MISHEIPKQVRNDDVTKKVAVIQNRALNQDKITNKTQNGCCHLVLNQVQDVSGSSIRIRSNINPTSMRIFGTFLSESGFLGLEDE